MPDSNIVNCLEQMVTSIESYAQEQHVALSLSILKPELPVSCNEALVSSELAKFVCKIIDFTPQSHSVTIVLSDYLMDKELMILNIINTGIDLSRLSEAISLISFTPEIEKHHNGGTKFIFEIPLTANEPSNLKSENINNIVQLRYSPYYLEIGKRLTTHFSNIDNLEKLAEQRGAKEGAFLKRVNLVISNHMHDYRFNVEMLAKAMALSRAQLYRKLKALTEMSPVQYILFMRLLISEELLEDTSLDLNISEVGFKVGFVSNSHFSRAFKKQFGFNPSALLQKDSDNI